MAVRKRELDLQQKRLEQQQRAQQEQQQLSYAAGNNEIYESNDGEIREVIS